MSFFFRIFLPSLIIYLLVFQVTSIYLFSILENLNK